LPDTRLPDFGGADFDRAGFDRIDFVADLGRADLDLRMDLVRLGAVMRLVAFRPRVAIVSSPAKP
jgi:hypothetical protein